jgi:hypothetical protein
VLLDGMPMHMFPDEQPERIPMDKAEFDQFDVFTPKHHAYSRDRRFAQALEISLTR